MQDTRLIRNQLETYFVKVGETTCFSVLIMNVVIIQNPDKKIIIYRYKSLSLFTSTPLHILGCIARNCWTGSINKPQLYIGLEAPLSRVLSCIPHPRLASHSTTHPKLVFLLIFKI